MNTEAFNEFFRNADQPNNVRHKIYLLRNLRQLKNDVARKNIQAVRSQILRKMNEGNLEAVDSSTNGIETKLTKIANEIPAVLDTQSSNRENERLTKPSLIPLNDCEPSLQSGIVFLSAIELLGTLYDISKDSAFFRQQERLVSIIQTMKKSETSDKELEHLQAELFKLYQVKNKFERTLHV